MSVIKPKPNLVPCQTCNKKGRAEVHKECPARCKFGWIIKRLL